MITSRSHLDELIAQPPPVPPSQQLNRLPSFNNRRISCESTAGISEGFLTYIQEEIRNTYRKRRMLLASVFVIFFICIIAITAAALTQTKQWGRRRCKYVLSDCPAAASRTQHYRT